MDDLFIRIKKVISEQLVVSEEKITSSARFVEDLGADSLDTVELVMALEEAFGVDIPDEDAESIHTIQDMMNYIEQNSKKKKEIA